MTDKSQEDCRMDEQGCGRPNCKNIEHRIDGYCSIYCRDMHELEVELEACQQELAEAQEDAEMQHEIHVMLIEDAVSKYEASQAEVKRLEDLYNSDRANYLDDITLLQAECKRLQTELVKTKRYNYKGEEIT